MKRARAQGRAAPCDVLRRLDVFNPRCDRQSARLPTKDGTHSDRALYVRGGNVRLPPVPRVDVSMHAPHGFR